MYDQGCCGKTFLPEFLHRMSFVLSDKAFSQKLAFLEAVRFAEDEARFRLF